MITRLRCIITPETLPYHNLALEEYLTLHTEPGECILYLWQNERTVVIGRNQDAWQECRVAALEADGGHLVRRLSGGGAVYHDLGNLNYTFMVRQPDYDVQRQLAVILRAVQSLGAAAKQSGRNDVLIQGRKFSGSAFYRSGDFCYQHGTLLLQVDAAQMEKYLNVSLAKLASKSIASVRARVTNLADWVPGLTTERMVQAMRTAFGEVYGLPVETLGEAALPAAEIAARQQHFADESWIFGRRQEFTYKAEHRFAWGEICLQFSIKQARMYHLRVFSDAMEQEYAPALEKSLEGTAYNFRTLSEAVDRVDIAAADLPQLKADTKQLLQSML